MHWSIYKSYFKDINADTERFLISIIKSNIKLLFDKENLFLLFLDFISYNFKTLSFKKSFQYSSFLCYLNEWEREKKLTLL